MNLVAGILKTRRGQWSGKNGSHFLISSIFAVFFGCASSSTTKIPDLSTLTPTDIQKRVAVHLNHLESFQGRAKIIIELPGKGYNGSSSVYINLPDSIFVKTEAIFGIDIGALFVDQANFGAYAPRDNVFYYGEVETLRLSDFLQVELETEELYEVFTGLVQVIVDSTSQLSFDDGKFVITTQAEKGILKYWIDPRKYVVTESQLLGEDDQVLFTKKFERFKKKNNLELPRIIRLTRPKARERITVYYTRQEINKGIAAKQFQMKVPKNARKVYWGDIDQPTIKRDSHKNQKTND